MKGLVYLFVTAFFLTGCCKACCCLRKAEAVKAAEKARLDSVMEADSFERAFHRDSVLLAEECKKFTAYLDSLHADELRTGWYHRNDRDSVRLTPYSKRKGMVEEECEFWDNEGYTPEELRHEKEMLLTGASLLMRDADRNLDTIVNYIHLTFIIIP